MKINRTMWILLLMIMMAGMSYAFTVNLVSPAASSTIRGTSDQLINITMPTMNGTAYCQLQVASASTANSSGYNLFNFTNQSVGPQNQVNTTLNFSTLRFEDSTDYIFTVNCQNNSHSQTGTDTNTGITIDYSIPSAPNSTSTSETKFDSGDTLTFTVRDDTTTSCTIYFDSQAPIAGTYSTSTCSYTFDKSTLPDKVYNSVFARASDGTNTTDSATYKFIVENNKNTNNPLAGVNQAVTTNVGAQQLGITTPNTSTDNTLMYAFILAIVWYVFFYNKK